jgi:hypothetical protein
VIPPADLQRAAERAKEQTARLCTLKEKAIPTLDLEPPSTSTAMTPAAYMCAALQALPSSRPHVAILLQISPNTLLLPDRGSPLDRWAVHTRGGDTPPPPTTTASITAPARHISARAARGARSKSLLHVADQHGCVTAQVTSLHLPPDGLWSCWWQTAHTTPSEQHHPSIAQHLQHTRVRRGGVRARPACSQRNSLSRRCS